MEREGFFLGFQKAAGGTANTAGRLIDATSEAVCMETGTTRNVLIRGEQVPNRYAYSGPGPL